MARNPNLDPSAFFLEGDRAKGVLLIHGFTGSPPEMRLIGDYLNGRGYTVSAPLLPGHGTTVEDMNRQSWRDWADHVEGAYQELLARCQRVFVGGLSMGSLLSLHLAASHPEVPGIVLYAPAAKVDNRLLYLTPVMKYVMPITTKSGESDLGDPEAESLFWSYESYPVGAAHELLKLIYRVRRILPNVQCPALIFHAARDMHIKDEGARYVADSIGSREKELVVLHHSGHGLTVDQEWETVAEKTFDFFEKRLG
jgi:carboxylesterase